MGIYSTILHTVPDSEESPEEKVTANEQENDDF